MTAALIAWAIATLADIVTTTIALRQGHTEANPIMRRIMRSYKGRRWIAAKIGIACIVAALAFYVSTSAPGVAAGMLWLVAAVTGLVALNNYRIIRR